VKKTSDLARKKTMNGVTWINWLRWLSSYSNKINLISDWKRTCLENVINTQNFCETNNLDINVILCIINVFSQLIINLQNLYINVKYINRKNLKPKISRLGLISNSFHGIKTSKLLTVVNLFRVPSICMKYACTDHKNST
jgi:hypothetical protein